TSNESISDSSQSTEQDRPKLPPIDFSAFIAELGMTAVTYLGGYQNPETNEVLVDLEMAKRAIDTIDLLKEKTKGNLTAPESNLLDNTLYNLRMTYIRIANNPPSPPHPETPESTTEAPSEETETETE
ncbi:DUF1844 domain-containing protein, partial [Candidatus Poribacteria bacterium]|nr:DUF1844 domain-containing protein [Candidatus Poribacteria bacterium]